MIIDVLILPTVEHFHSYIGQNNCYANFENKGFEEKREITINYNNDALLPLLFVY